MSEPPWFCWTFSAVSEFLHQRECCLPSASCWKFLPWLLSVMDCDPEMEEEINPFLPKLPLVRAFCHGKAEASAGWYVSTLAAFRTATPRKNLRQAFSTSSLVLTLRSCWSSLALRMLITGAHALCAVHCAVWEEESEKHANPTPPSHSPLHLACILIVI